MRAVADPLLPNGSVTPNVQLPAGTTGIVVFAQPDAEVNALNVCLAALRDLDANAAARVALYVANRHPFMEAAS